MRSKKRVRWGQNELRISSWQINEKQGFLVESFGFETQTTEEAQQCGQGSQKDH